MSSNNSKVKYNSRVGIDTDMANFIDYANVFEKKVLDTETLAVKPGLEIDTVEYSIDRLGMLYKKIDHTRLTDNNVSSGALAVALGVYTTSAVMLDFVKNESVSRDVVLDSAEMGYDLCEQLHYYLRRRAGGLKKIKSQELGFVAELAVLNMTIFGAAESPGLPFNHSYLLSEAGKDKTLADGLLQDVDLLVANSASGDHTPVQIKLKSSKKEYREDIKVVRISEITDSDQPLNIGIGKMLEWYDQPAADRRDTYSLFLDKILDEK